MISASTSSALFFTTLLVASFSVEISAKRGCSAFGHSCYGGHGKRSYPETIEYDVGRGNKGGEVPQMDYELSRSSDGEKLALVPPSHGFYGQEQRSLNSFHERPRSPWSLLIRKLSMPYRRTQPGFSDLMK